MANGAVAELNEHEATFLDNPFVGIVTTLREDGSPHSTVVWVGCEDDTVSFNTTRDSAKKRHLERNPNVSVLVIDPAHSRRWVAVSGKAELTEDGADKHIDRLAKKYLGLDTFPLHNPDDPRITVLIRPSYIESIGLDGS